MPNHILAISSEKVYFRANLSNHVSTFCTYRSFTKNIVQRPHMKVVLHFTCTGVELLNECTAEEKLKYI